MHLIKDENGNLVQRTQFQEMTVQVLLLQMPKIIKILQKPAVSMLIPTRDLKAMTIHILTSRTAAQAAAPAREETVRMRQWHS